MLRHCQFIVNTLLLVVVQYVTYDVCHVCHNCSCCNCNGFQQMHWLVRVDKPHDDKICLDRRLHSGLSQNMQVATCEACADAVQGQMQLDQTYIMMLDETHVLCR